MSKEYAGEEFKPAKECVLTDAPSVENQQQEQGVQQCEGTVNVPKDFFIIPVPKHLRHDPENPAHFGLFLNIVFALATTFSAYLLTCDRTGRVC